MAEFANYEQAEAKIADLKDFRGTNWRGTTDKTDVFFGKLEGQDYKDFLAAWTDGTLVYVVMSWSTPIAWVLEDGTRVVPRQWYSQTTTRQQRAVRRAWGMKEI